MTNEHTVRERSVDPGTAGSTSITLALAEIRARGYRAHEEGKGRISGNPHVRGTAEYGAWEEGWLVREKAILNNAGYETPLSPMAYAQIKAAGFEAHKSGAMRPCNPYAPHTEQHRVWDIDIGYMDRHRAVAAIGKMNSAAAEPAPAAATFLGLDEEGLARYRIGGRPDDDDEALALEGDAPEAVAGHSETLASRIFHQLTGCPDLRLSAVPAKVLAVGLRHLATALDREVAQHDMDPALELLERVSAAYNDLIDGANQMDVTAHRHIAGAIDELARAIDRAEDELAPYIAARAARQAVSELLATQERRAA
ncbi:hypothetical protein CCP1ISM_110013 [Azospirillaceae bacterium]